MHLFTSDSEEVGRLLKWFHHIRLLLEKCIKLLWKNEGGRDDLELKAAIARVDSRRAQVHCALSILYSVRVITPHNPIRSHRVRSTLKALQHEVWEDWKFIHFAVYGYRAPAVYFKSSNTSDELFSDEMNLNEEVLPSLSLYSPGDPSLNLVEKELHWFLLRVPIMNCYCYWLKGEWEKNSLDDKKVAIIHSRLLLFRAHVDYALSKLYHLRAMKFRNYTTTIEVVRQIATRKHSMWEAWNLIHFATFGVEASSSLGSICHKTDKSCAICFKELQKTNINEMDKLRLKCCSHVVHLDCIMSWWQLNNTCPLCRNFDCRPVFY
ncbi:hypothetical protein AMTR_s00024p00202110 [Amborella trichopoda]|uniref:RING-type domain-containing protein n=1 Tax=Amborella trichopoda TaxID=13333 RepID=W1PV85_AMBTC|nr:hypothetical protein AMTR_s00024p00202110 [Amborella trichopoda]